MRNKIDWSEYFGVGEGSNSFKKVVEKAYEKAGSGKRLAEEIGSNIKTTQRMLARIGVGGVRESCVTTAVRPYMMPGELEIDTISRLVKDCNSFRLVAQKLGVKENTLRFRVTSLGVKGLLRSHKKNNCNPDEGLSNETVDYLNDILPAEITWICKRYNVSEEAFKMACRKNDDVGL